MKQAQPEYIQKAQIEISCPHCGGVSTWSLLETLNQCSYCGSILSWPYPEGEPDYLVAETVIQDDAGLIDVLAMYDAMREASRRRGAVRSQGSDYDPEFYYDLGAGFTDTSVYEIKRERLPLFRILKSVRLYVPYQLISSLLVFHVLGRVASERKAFQSLFFQAEAIVPGYPDEWNFRDRGLHMTTQKLKPLSIAHLGNDFIATGPALKEIEKVTRQWTGQRKIIESEIQPISFDGKVLESHRWWVYRPYYFVHAKTPLGPSWFLVDGQFATIAGTPTVEEVHRILRRKWKKLDVHTLRTVNVRVVPFRCPNCGWDMEFRKGVYQICGNCTRVSEVRGDGLELVPYRIVPDEQIEWWPKHHRGPKVWLPFWRIEPSMLVERKAYDDLAKIAGAIVPLKTPDSLQTAPTNPSESKTHLFLPAFDCLTVARYDAWAFEFGSRLSAASISPCETTIHHVKSTKDLILSPSLHQDLIPGLFPQIIATYFAPQVQARMNTMLIKRLNESHVRMKNLELVFVPAALVETRGSDPKLQGPRQAIEWFPLKNGVWPPALQRNVRRWKAMNSKDQDPAPQRRLKWMTSAFTKRI